uniref:Uncharacterized protein n=1 Tax=Timema genevievae TaxID=629358 RepID=A0A7R9JRD4_TIMGE|nr:unnamed protein product [Timema genevievae]
MLVVSSHAAVATVFMRVRWQGRWRYVPSRLCSRLHYKACHEDGRGSQVSSIKGPHWRQQLGFLQTNTPRNRLPALVTSGVGNSMYLSSSRVYQREAENSAAAHRSIKQSRCERFINARRRIVQPMIDQSNRAGVMESDCDKFMTKHVDTYIPELPDALKITIKNTYRNQEREESHTYVEPESTGRLKLVDAGFPTDLHPLPLPCHLTHPTTINQARQYEMYPHLRGGMVENPPLYAQTGSSPNLSVIGILVCCESDALDYATTKVARQTLKLVKMKERYCKKMSGIKMSNKREPNLLDLSSSAIVLRVYRSSLEPSSLPHTVAVNSSNLTERH